MQIPCHYTEEELIRITYELLEKNKLQDAYIRPIIVAGENMNVVSATDSVLIMQCWPWCKLMGNKLLRVKTSKFQRPNPKACFVEAKITGHYINSISATNEIKALGYDEALLHRYE